MPEDAARKPVLETICRAGAITEQGLGKPQERQGFAARTVALTTAVERMYARH